MYLALFEYREVKGISILLTTSSPEWSPLASKSGVGSNTENQDRKSAMGGGNLCMPATMSPIMHVPFGLYKFETSTIYPIHLHGTRFLLDDVIVSVLSDIPHVLPVCVL